MLLYLLKQRILSYSNIRILSKGYHIFVFGIRFILRLPGQIYLSYLCSIDVTDFDEILPVCSPNRDTLK